MATVTEAFIQNGEISFVPAVDEVPTSSRTEGSVTINNVGSPGEPAYFEVHFRTEAVVEFEGIKRRLYFSPTIQLTGLDKTASISEIEGKAAREVAPLFRAIADFIEKQVADYDERYPLETDSQASDMGELDTGTP